MSEREICERCRKPKAQLLAEVYPGSPYCWIAGADAHRIAELKAALETAHRSRDTRQAAVLDWVRSTFGEATLAPEERIMRFLEEAIELAQAEELAPERIHALIDHVYSKPPGEPVQEVGGVSVTLLAYCEMRGISADHSEKTEFERVLSIPADHFRKRHDIKARAGVAVFSDAAGQSS